MVIHNALSEVLWAPSARLRWSPSLSSLLFSSLSLQIAIESSTLLYCSFVIICGLLRCFTDNDDPTRRRSNTYRRTAIARTTMARLPWPIRTLWVPRKFFRQLNKTHILGIFLILSWNCMLCKLIRIASSRRFLWVHSTYHYCVDDK